MDDKSLDALFSGLTEVSAPSIVQEQDDAPHPSPPSKKDRKGKNTKASANAETAKRKQQLEERGEERLCTIVSSEKIKKLRIIATREGLQLKNVLDAAFAKAIGSYERKHGKIEEDAKKSTKDLF